MPSRVASEFDMLFGEKLNYCRRNSMTRDIVEVIGRLKYVKEGDYYKGKQYIIVSLLGHVLEWFAKEECNKKLKRY